jgi:hypothetical protein
MRERPLLMSGPMVRAILEGRKTQTRRIAKTGRDNCVPAKRGGSAFRVVTHITNAAHLCPYGVPGDRLWIRETWGVAIGSGGWANGDAVLNYRADGHQVGMSRQRFDLIATVGNLRGVHDGKWRPSIHMPRWASRLTLELTEVHAESLQEIGRDDAKAEGLMAVSQDFGSPLRWGIITKGKAPGEDRDSWPWERFEPHPVDAYRTLWNDLNSHRAPWEHNPWVWVLTFKVVT